MHVRSLGLRRPTYSQLLKYVCIYVCKRSCQTLFRGLSTRASRKPFLLSLSLFSRSLSARRCSLTRRFTDLLVNGTPFSCTRGGNRLHSLLDAIQTVCAGEDTSFVRLVDFFFGGGFSTLSRLEERNFENFGNLVGKNIFWEALKSNISN